MHGADGIGTELMAQRLDVAVDGAGAGCIDPVPDLFEQLFAGEHRLRAAGQRGQQIELGGGQMHLFRTNLVVAHRLSTIKNADEIIVLTENGIEERGTHQELVEKNGIYSKLNKK